MKDLNRLLDEPDTDPLEADLLRLARREGPSNAARERILAGLAVAAAAGTVSSASAAASKGTSAAKAVPSRAALKWALFGAVGIGAGALALLVSGHHAPKPASAPANPALRVAPMAAPTASSAATAAATETETELSPVTKLEDLPRLSASGGSVHAAPAPSLADEVAAIKAAKSALLAGNASEALRQLDAYRARFPRGRLTQEASVVRIEALLKSGNRGAASAAGDRFLAAHADSPYAARVHTLIGH